jgi:hypothetical protein
MYMTQITIDNKQYDLDSLSEDAKAQLFSLQFCDQELARLQAQTGSTSNSTRSLFQSFASSLTR